MGAEWAQFKSKRVTINMREEGLLNKRRWEKKAGLVECPSDWAGTETEQAKSEE